MRLVERKNIDTNKWNEAVKKAEIENIFCYAWYLDATCKNWSAFIHEDYQTIFPIPYSSKLGQKQIFQPPFTRELDILGTDFDWEKVLKTLSKDFKGIHFRNQSNEIAQNPEARIHQFIDLTDTFKLSNNAKRLIKKADPLFTLRTTNKPDKLINLFKETAFHKIDSISEADLRSLSKLISAAINNEQCDIIELKENDEIVAAGCFLKDKKRITYLKGAATESAKKNGAMYYLIHSAIAKYKSNFNVFDFGGSDVENVANFYKKFGAKDRTYYNYTINNFPAWFKALKRIRK